MTTTTKRLLMLLLAFALFAAGLFFYNATTQPASAGPNCPGGATRTVHAGVQSAVWPHTTFYTISQTVTWSWDCKGHFTNSTPKWSRSFWVNNCALCLWSFDHWYAPERTAGGPPQYVNNWRRSEQKAQFTLQEGPLTKHNVIGVWQTVGAYPGGYREGIIT